MNKLLLKIAINDELSFFDSKAQTVISMGSDSTTDDIFMNTTLLSGRNILFKQEGEKWYISNIGNNYGIHYGNSKLKPNTTKRFKVDRMISLEDKQTKQRIYVSRIRNIKAHKDLIFKSKTAGKANSSLTLVGKNIFYIGRDPSCDIIIDNPQVDPFNTKIFFDGYNYFISDLKSSNGTTVNNQYIKTQMLKSFDFINLPSAVYMFYKNELIYAKDQNGIDIDAVGLSKTVKDYHSKKSIKLISDVSLHIGSGEFVAIVGGSGAGKSTILDAINGRRPANCGKVYYDLSDYYENQLSYQSIIGYVPQRDIMHENLTVLKSLYYYASIRMRHHLSKPEILELCQKAMKDVSLLEKAHVKVSALSGGQKKRVSIAMELLANPKVIFLDEPTSGLSPDLDLELMTLLKSLAAEQGRTIIVITHAMDNVDKCDKLAFLGKGGRLCYYGKPSKIFKFFELKKFAQIFSLLSSEQKSVEYEQKYRSSPGYAEVVKYLDSIYNEDKTTIEDKR